MLSSSLEEKVAQLQKRVERNDADVVAHFAEMRLFFREWSERADGRFARLEERVSTLERRMDVLERRMDVLERRMDALERRMEVLERRVDAGFTMVGHRFDRIERLLNASIKHQGLVNRQTDQRLKRLERANARRPKAS